MTEGNYWVYAFSVQPSSAGDRTQREINEVLAKVRAQLEKFHENGRPGKMIEIQIKEMFRNA